MSRRRGGSRASVRAAVVLLQKPLSVCWRGRCYSYAICNGGRPRLTVFATQRKHQGAGAKSARCARPDRTTPVPEWPPDMTHTRCMRIACVSSHALRVVRSDPLILLNSVDDELFGLPARPPCHHLAWHTGVFQKQLVYSRARCQSADLVSAMWLWSPPPAVCTAKGV